MRIRGSVIAFVLVAASGLAAACHPSVQPIEGGTTTSGSGGGSGANKPQVWKGYVENYQFDDGIDTLEITLSADRKSSTVVMGDQPLFPAPTDPNVPSPPVFRESNIQGPPRAVTGFAFSGIGSTVTPTRMTFSVDPNEQWNAWCALETPIAWGNAPSNTYECLPNAGTTSVDTKNGPQCFYGEGANMTPVDCGKLALCLGFMVCKCSATACDVPVPSEGSLRFDLAISGAHADGSVVGLSGTSVYNVHLDLQ